MAPGSSNSRKSVVRGPCLKLTVPEVLAAVDSLYADELKPHGRVILKRLRERAAAKAAEERGLRAEDVDPESMPRIDPNRLRAFCQTCHRLVVELEEGNEYSVKRVGQSNYFLDISSPVDLYPPRMWEEAVAYFEGFHVDEMLPSGRYACALELARRGLAFLEGRSLGQICHIVQLAISSHKILGHCKGALVPHRHSEAWMKEQCAQYQMPVLAKDSTGLPVVSWAQARDGVRALLNMRTNSEAGVISLSNVKRLFRSEFKLEFSETSLGHSRIFDALQDPRVHDICSVQAQGSGQFLVKRAKPESWQMPAAPVHQAASSTPFRDPKCHPSVFWSPAADPGGVYSSVYMGCVMLPSMPISVNSPPLSLSMLRAAKIDLGMDNVQGWLSTEAPPQASSKTPTRVLDASSREKHNESMDQALSTDVPEESSPSVGAASSSEYFDDDHKPLNHHVQRCRAVSWADMEDYMTSDMEEDSDDALYMNEKSMPSTHSRKSRAVSWADMDDADSSDDALWILGS